MKGKKREREITKLGRVNCVIFQELLVIIYTSLSGPSILLESFDSSAPSLRVQQCIRVVPVYVCERDCGTSLLPINYIDPSTLHTMLLSYSTYNLVYYMFNITFVLTHESFVNMLIISLPAAFIQGLNSMRSISFMRK